MPVRRAAGGTWFYQCLECRATGHYFTTDDDALDAMVAHWSSSGCIQDGTVVHSSEEGSA